MACIVDLFAQLEGSPDTGGNWFYTGAAPATFSADTCPNDPPAATASYSPGDQLGTGEDICVDLTGLSPDSYEFTYVLPSPNTPDDCGVDCVACATVTVEVLAAPVDGDPVEYCSGDCDPVNLYGLLGNTPSTSGDWSYSGPGTWGPSGGQSVDGLGNNDTFKPCTATGIGVGVHTFTYTVESDPSGCAECVATVEVTVVEAPDAGSDGVAAVCV